MASENRRYLGIFAGFVILFAVIGNVSFVKESISMVLLSAYMPMIFIYYGAKYNGMEQCNDDGKNAWEMFKKMLLPYFWFTLFYIMIDAIKIIASHDYKSNTISEDFLNGLTLYGNSVLWYLPVLFIAAVLYDLFRKRIKLIIVFIIFAIFSLAGILLLGDLNEMILNADNMLKMIGFRIFALCWRVVLALLFMSVGEVTDLIINALYKNKLVIALVAFVFTGLGVALCYFNGLSHFENLDLGKSYFYFSGITLLGIGLLSFAKWIGQARVFEFIGMNARIIYLTFIDFGVITLATKVDAILLKIFDNNFIGHVANLLTIVAVELVIIIVINKLFYFTVAKEPNNTFGLIAKNDND